MFILQQCSRKMFLAAMKCFCEAIQILSTGTPQVSGMWWLRKICCLRCCICEPKWTVWGKLILKNKLNLNPVGKTTNIWGRKWKRCISTSFSLKEKDFWWANILFFMYFLWLSKIIGVGNLTDVRLHLSQVSISVVESTSNYIPHSKDAWSATILPPVPVTCVHYHSSSASNFDRRSTYFLNS